jgi:hypothetical protein
MGCTHTKGMLCKNDISLKRGCRDRVVVGLTWRGVLETTLCDEVCQ